MRNVAKAKKPTEKKNMIKNMNHVNPVTPHSDDAVWHSDGEMVSVYESGRMGGEKTRKKTR